MFFFKKKEKKKESEAPSVNKEELIAQAEGRIKELEGKEGNDRVSLLNEIGSLFTQAEETDQAIRLLWSSVFVTLVAKKYRFMQFELDMVFDTH